MGHYSLNLWVRYTFEMHRAASAIITHNNRVLLLHRDNIPTITDPDKWGLVGGNVEEGETVEQGARREIKEESNLNPRHLEYLGRTVMEDYEVSLYTVKLDEDEVANVKLGNEGSEIRFFTYDELKTLSLTEHLQYYLNKHPESAKKLVEGGKVVAEELSLI